MKEIGSWDYEANAPLVPIEVVGKKDSFKTKAYVDSGATSLVIPKGVEKKISMTLLGTTTVLTVGGIIEEEVFLGKVNFLGREFEVSIICRDVLGMESLIGREVLDNFKVCLDGKRKVISVLE